MAQEREIAIRIPESQARRIEKVTKSDLSELVYRLVMDFFEDGRRQSIETKRQGLGWHKDVYIALLKHVGDGGISRFVRQAVYEDLSTFEKDLIEPPDWKEGRVVESSNKKRSSPTDRISVMAPMMFPAQWIERIESRWPKHVGPYIKAVTQRRLEKQLKVEFPTQRGLGDFLGR